MKNYFVITLICLFFLSNKLFAQSNYTLKAQILDSTTSTPLQDASIKLFENNKYLNGTSSKTDGSFEITLKKGDYTLVIEYVSYLKISRSITLNENLDLGIIKLESDNKSLAELVVTSEKSSTELSLDKRVFNVGKDLATAGGSAQDVLINVPSVTVDPDGAIKLRGNSNVRILIDGKPSAMVSFKGGAGLRQLQASMIDRVEVITNPSARYEAEGQAGIINIILKKDNKQGFNGSFELITGIPDNYGAAANLNYRKGKINFFANYSLAYKSNPYIGNLYQEFNDNDTLKILKQENSGTVSGLDNNIRSGLEYYFTEKSVLTASYLYSRAGGKRLTENIYNDYLNSLENKTGTITRTQEEIEREPLSEYVLNYKKEFQQKNHELSAQFKFLDHFENSDQKFFQKGILSNGQTDAKNSVNQTSVNDEFEKQYLVQLDYQKPINKSSKIELGVRGSWRDMVNDFIVNDIINGQEIPVKGLDNYFIYSEKINAAYGIYANKIKKTSFQIGLRAESSKINTVLRETKEENPRKYNNLFPSFHISNTLNKNNSLQLSYSKRIRRPVYNDLSPFMTVSDSRNFFSGNPNLDPEFTDVIELGELYNFEKGSLSSSVYFRNTVNNIFSIRRLNSEGFSTTMPENLNSEKDYGIDISSNYNPTKWWKMDGNLNIFHADIDGSNIDKKYVVATNTWFAKYTSRFTLKNGMDIQIRNNYEAAQKTAQGSRKQIYFMDLSLRKTLWNKKGALNFSILDVFNSRWNRFTNEGTNFYTVNNRQFRPRQINLTLSYKIKQ